MGTASVQEIGLFCGTFNPVHTGHLLIAECARDQFDLEKVIFVTSPAPPHREDTLLDGRARHEMVQAAIEDNPFFEASALELEREGPSYTIDTIKQIRTTYGSTARINLIIGGDNLRHLSTWNRADELAKSCRILVVPRLRYENVVKDGFRMVGEEPVEVEEQFENASIESVDFPGIAISGSRIRERIREGKTVLYMVPPRVNKLILDRGYFAGKEGSCSPPSSSAMEAAGAKGDREK